MMMDKDRLEGEKDRKEAPPPADGLRRSRRLQNRPSRNPIGDGEGHGESGGYTGSDRKRKRLPRQQEEDNEVEEVEEDTRKIHVGDGADDGVNVSVQFDPKQATPNSGNEGRVEEEANIMMDKTSLLHRVKGEGRGRSRSSSFPTVGKAVAAGRSESAVAVSPEKSREAHHCLFIENVLDVVFKHILEQPGPGRDVAKDVQNIRLVCKTWKTSMTRLYRQTTGATATFNDYEPPGSNRIRTTLTEFMETMTASEMIPVQKFTFCGVFRRFRRTNPEVFRKFLVTCGPDAVSLRIHANSSDSEGITAALENMADFQMAKLKTLALNIWQDHHHEQVRLKPNREHENVKLVQLLLAAAKTLREFELSYERSSIPAYRIQHEIVLHQLTTAIVREIPRTVKELKLNLHMNESGFNTLAGIPSQLERFKFVANSALGGKTLYQFLQSQAATMKVVRLFYDVRDGNLVEFPRLDELVHLELPHLTIRIPTPSNFAETFPKLQCLMIRHMQLEASCIGLQGLLSSVKKASRSVKVLDLPRWDCTVTAPLFKDLAKSFPCLTELHIPLFDVTKEMMGEVFTYLDNLELLNIRFHFSDRTKNANWVESMFSGISESDCFRIKRLQDFDNENLNELQRQPSILNMTKLRKLVIGTCGGGIRWFRFTDFSAHFVFLKMDNLREMRLPNWVVEFSPMYSELMKDKLVLRGRRKY